jgi:hypothetical protein
LAYSKKLRSTGFTEQQEEVAAEAQKEAIEIVIQRLRSDTLTTWQQNLIWLKSNLNLSVGSSPLVSFKRP